MRDLNAHDVFAALKVIKKIGVKDELIELATYMNSGQEKNQEQVGAKLVLSVLANAGDEEAERAFFSFLAGPLESTPEELAKTPLLELGTRITEYIKSQDQERWSGFFHFLAEALKRK